MVARYVSFAIFICAIIITLSPVAQGVDLDFSMTTRGVPSLGAHGLQFFLSSVREDPHLQKGYNHLSEFRFKEAISELEICIKNNQGNAAILSEAYTYLGYCYLNLRDRARSIKSLETSIKLNPRNELAYFFLANEYALDGEMEKAKRNYETALSIHPRFTAAMKMLAEIYRDVGDSKNSLIFYKKLVQVLPNSGYYRFQLYRAFYSQDMLDEAEEQLKVLLRLEPDNTLNVGRLGEVYLKKKEYEKALDTYDALVAREKDSYKGYLGRAQVYLAMGRLKEASRESKVAEGRNPGLKEIRDVQFEIDRVVYEKRRRFINLSLVIGFFIVLFGLMSYYVYSTHRNSFFLTIISDFNEHIEQIYDIGELTSFILNFFCETLSIEKGFLLLYNRQNNTLSVSVSRGAGEDASGSFQIITGNELANWMMQESRPILSIKGIERSKLFEEAFPSLLERLRVGKMSYLIPLRDKNNCIGFVALGYPVEEHRHKLTYNELLMSLGNAASQSLQTLFLFESSIIDELTGIYNKRYFFQSLSTELKRADRYQQPCSLCTLDIDDFKKLNDTYGHSLGDQILKQFGAILKNNTREGIDVAARTGGEEFHLILPATSNDAACIVSERVRVSVEEHTFEGFDKPIRATVSIGIATYPDHGVNESDLIKISDKALYLAKSSGKNRCAQADEVEKGREKRSFKSELTLEKRFDHLNIKDEATGLFNFSYFSLRIKEEVKRAERYRFPCSLIVIQFDLDLSDEDKSPILEQIVVTVKSNLREGIDTPARIGDNLLAIIVPETPREKATIMAKRFIDYVEKRDMKISDGKISPIIGISSFPECAGNPDELMDSATEALKRPQVPGRYKILFAPPILADTK